MTELEIQYLHDLQKNRRHIVDTLNDPAAKGVWESIIGKYSGKAHFLYEVLQNADDVDATWAHFELYDDRLVFRHNGKRLFSFSNPATEEEDKPKKKLGDINSITSIGHSSKTEGNKIGKFGMGFKAVFQYTKTPSIYDPKIAFKIEDYMVPILLEEDYPGRKSDETVFVFPFNRDDITAEEAIEDISDKLESLVMPILFLHSLEEVSFDCFGKKGEFKKEIKDTKDFGETVATRVLLTGPSKEDKENLWLFTRQDNGLDYSVGFFLNEEEKLIPKSPYAFCYFPTLVTTNLNFLIQAPFLLTDSREGIKEKEKHNLKMVELLASLAADSFVYMRDIGGAGKKRLIDDDVMEIVPYKSEVFEQTGRISFMPFYDAVKKVFNSERIIPGRDCFVTKKEAYWADTEPIANLINDEQLTMLVSDNVHWIFPTKARHTYQTKESAAFSAYVNEMCESKNVTEEYFYSLISKDFIEAQDEKWLVKLYEYLLTERGLQVRVNKIKKVPIFWDEKGKAVSAYNEDGHESLYLPDEEAAGGFVTINANLYKNENTKKLLDELEIKAPDLKSKVYSKVIPQYNKDGKRNDRANFRTFLKYYIQCLTEERPDDDYYDGEWEASQLIDDIKNLQFICFINPKTGEEEVSWAKDLYFPTDELKRFFDGDDNGWFVNIEEYENYLSKRDFGYLEKFLKELGVEYTPRLLETAKLDEEYVHKTYGYKWERSTRKNEEYWVDKYIEGCENFLKRFIKNPSLEDSLLLWKQLVKIYAESWSVWIGGVHHYFYFDTHTEHFVGEETKRLRETPWIRTASGEFKAPKELTIQEMSPEYDLSGTRTDRLLSFLQIEDAHPEYAALPEEDRWKFEAVDLLINKGGANLEEIKEFLAWKEEKGRVYSDTTSPVDSDNINEKASQGPEDEVKKLSREEEVALELGKKASSKKKKSKPENVEDELKQEPEIEVDHDEYTKATIDYAEKIAQTKQKCEDEIAKITVLEDAQKRATESKKYSYEWFNAMLALESIDNGSENVRSREVTVVFSQVEREEGKQRTLILKNPDTPLKHVMEDLVDFPMVMKFADDSKKTLIIEGANIQSFSLRVKLKSSEGLDDINFSEVVEIRIDTKSPTFLLNELQKQFNDLQIEDEHGKLYHPEPEFDMQTNLCENIDFIFGPPGTGKTTYLSKDVILPILQSESKVKILVMTPTNKAADVIANRIMEVMGDDHSYENWLIRYGITADEELEESPIFSDKNIDIADYEQVVIITTIARFPYDYFIDKDKNRNFINGINWDYIIADEASMIPLVNLIYPLYAKTPKKFIVAGDPFQIEPTTAVDLWKDENIYTLVGLNSFTDIHTVPHDYHVELLKTQYRSIASIGEVFSNLTYGGVIKHAREDFERRELNIEQYLEYDSLNLIKFPVSKYESIYKAKKLKNSNYQTYSALFAYEFVCYVASALAKENPGEQFKLGLIAPYGAQASLIDKLVLAAKLPENIDVSCGTIHGFQGDECDVIVTLFNPPPKISGNDQMFLNKQNIVNVAISRAKDYLFILMPDDETDNIGSLRLIKNLESLVKKSGVYTEFGSHEIEKMMFDDELYLEKNSFSTGHQFVNVYGLPEQRYEIRSEDSAVDIQVHDAIKGEN